MRMGQTCAAAAGMLLLALGVSAGVGVAGQGPGSGNGPTTAPSLSEPQPLSGADQNGGGANGQCPGGPYCSTRDGSPSGNGNGDGNATGKPCAGCVGKADNKNPQGQMPNGSDANAGYECDRNNGIGKSNPAKDGEIRRCRVRRRAGGLLCNRCFGQTGGENLSRSGPPRLRREQLL